MIADHDRHSQGQVGGGHGSNSRRIFWTLLLTGSFMLVEVVGGVISGSLALLADAAHMLVDTVSLLFAWIAFWLSRRSADKVHAYGFHRFPVLAAFTNGITLIFIIGWIFIEAVGRLFNPAEVLAGPMLVSVAGCYVGLCLVRGLYQIEINRFRLLISTIALIFGTTMWAAHFISMLAIEFPFPVTYQIQMTLVSALLAIVLAGVSVYIIVADKQSINAFHGSVYMERVGFTPLRRHSRSE